MQFIGHCHVSYIRLGLEHVCFYVGPKNNKSTHHQIFRFRIFYRNIINYQINEDICSTACRVELLLLSLTSIPILTTNKTEDNHWTLQTNLCCQSVFWSGFVLSSDGHWMVSRSLSLINFKFSSEISLYISPWSHFCKTMTTKSRNQGHICMKFHQLQKQFAWCCMCRSWERLANDDQEFMKGLFHYRKNGGWKCWN